MEIRKFKKKQCFSVYLCSLTVFQLSGGYVLYKENEVSSKNDLVRFRLLPAMLGIALGIIYGVIFFILPENYGDLLIEEQMLLREREDEDNILGN